MVTASSPKTRVSHQPQPGPTRACARLSRALAAWVPGATVKGPAAGPAVTGPGSRLEIRLTDPREEPDMSKWVTQLAFRMAG
jgi:hypothetical protein